MAGSGRPSNEKLVEMAWFEWEALYCIALRCIYSMNVHRSNHLLTPIEVGEEIDVMILHTDPIPVSLNSLHAAALKNEKSLACQTRPIIFLVLVVFALNRALYGVFLYSSKARTE